MLDLANF